MADALIGCTGLVGGTLLRQTRFDDLYRSTNIEEIRGRSYDLLVCAGAPAEKWKANQDPARDKANLAQLMSCLQEVEAAHVMLVSTVDVYGAPLGVDEDTTVNPLDATAYGQHRFALEEFVRGRFETTCLRLPGLFGRGLKKNIIFDLLHDNALSAISPDSVFQFYDLERLWHDMQRARAQGLSLVNLAVEPVSVRDVARIGFARDFENASAGVPARYDMQTRYADAMGGRGRYLMSRDEVLTAIRRFVVAWQAGSR